jgi:hypothetical protein
MKNSHFLFSVLQAITLCYSANGDVTTKYRPPETCKSKSKKEGKFAFLAAEFRPKINVVQVEQKNDIIDIYSRPEFRCLKTVAHMSVAISGNAISGIAISGSAGRSLRYNAFILSTTNVTFIYLVMFTCMFECYLSVRVVMMPVCDHVCLCVIPACVCQVR